MAHPKINILEQTMSCEKELADALEENARLKSEMESLEQALTDPENQPSQFGTVTLEWHEAELVKLRQHAEAMAESIDRTVFSTTAQQDALAAYRADFPEGK